MFYPSTSLKVGVAAPSPLVIDVPKFHLFADPQAIPEGERKNIVAFLKETLRLKTQEVEKLEEQLSKPSRSRRLILWINKESYETIFSWWRQFAKKKKIAGNALFFVQDWQRCYPYGHLLGQVLHTVREEKNEVTLEHIPTGGLEAVFHKYLSGKNGKRRILRSPRHPLDSGELLITPERGADIYLTIDHTLQAIAEEEIAKAVEKAGAKGGWAVMMDPHSGEILALAQYPFFDPALCKKFFSNPRSIDDTKVKALTDPYEPGSVFKPLTIACGLLANEELIFRGKPPIFSPHEKISTIPRVFPGRSKVVKDLSTHKFLNMYMAMQKSSNVYMATIVYRIIQALGIEWYRGCLHDVFGIGEKTGIELPGETIGLLPRPGKVHPNGALEWSAPTPYSLAMGHNVLASSLQMLRAYCIIANGGFSVTPTLVQKIVGHSSDGKESVLLDKHHALKTRPKNRVLPVHVAEELKKGLKFTTKRGGSGTKAAIDQYTEAGKTGTSEKVIGGKYSKKDHISTFIGMAPVKEPKFVLLITIDEPEYKFIPGIGRNQRGGACAAPAFRAIGTRALAYLGVEPDDPFGFSPGDPRRDSRQADWENEVSHLEELYKLWNK